MRKLLLAALLGAIALPASAGSTFLGVDDQGVSNTPGTQLLIGTTEALLTGTTTHEVINKPGSELAISAVSLPLPSGAATSANQTTGNASLATIAGDTTSLDAKIPSQGAAAIAGSIPVNIASDQVVPISATSLPLPSGAATAANQSTGNASLATIAGDTTSLDAKLPSQGSATSANSLPVVIASDQGAIPVTGDFDIGGSTVQVKGMGAFAYARSEDVACSPTNVSFTGLIDEIELQALGGECVFTILGGNTITVKKNTAESFKLNYTAAGTASTVTCSSKSGGAQCNVNITGSN